MTADQQLMWAVNQRREEALERRDEAQRDADWYAQISEALRREDADARAAS